MSNTPKANARQVGGDHYKTGGTELWDLFGPEAIMFYATRYVARWRKKDGLKDLEKGKHTVEKLRELVTLGAQRPQLPVDRIHVETWAKNQGCDWAEQTIILRIMFWNDKRDIDEAIQGIEYLIEKETPKGFAAMPLVGVEVVPDKDMPEGALRAEYAGLVERQNNAAGYGWGAAVGVRHERMQEIERELHRREQLVNRREVGLTSPEPTNTDVLAAHYKTQEEGYG